MLKSGEVRVGVDLGCSKVLAVAVTAEGDDELRVLGYSAAASKGIAKGRVVDTKALSETLERVMTRLEGDLNRNLPEVVVSAGSKAFQTVGTQGFVDLLPAGRAVRPVDMMHAVTHSQQIAIQPGHEQLMAIPREYRVDGKSAKTDPMGLHGNRLDVLTTVVTVESGEVDRIQSAFEGARRSVVDLIPGPLASLSGSTPDFSKVSGTQIVIDLGHGRTDIAVLLGDGVAYLGTIPIGAWLVTNDIAYLLKVDLPEAERLKCREATCDLEGVGSNNSVMVNQPGQGTGRPMKRRVLCEIVESRMKETARFVGKALDDAGFGGERDATVVLTGGGSLLGGVDVVFKDALGVSKVKSSWPKLSGQHARHLGVPEATAAVGLARLALETNRDSLQPVHRDGGFMDRIRAIGTRLLSDRG